MSSTRAQVGLSTKTEREFWDDVFMAKLNQGHDAMFAAQEANAAVAARKLAHGVRK